MDNCESPRMTDNTQHVVDDSTNRTYFVRTEGEWRPSSSVVLSESLDISENKRCKSGESTSSISSLNDRCNRYLSFGRTTTPATQQGHNQKQQISRRFLRRPVINFDQYMSFVPLKGRKLITANNINARIQKRNNERVCRPYSTYSVPISCDRFSIGPYGLPFESGATGRYKQSNLSRSYPGFEQPFHHSNEQNRKFCINEELNLFCIERHQGVLRRPPDIPFRGTKPVNTPKIHVVAHERMAAVHQTLAHSHQQTKPSPAEYNIAVELVARLQDQRRKGNGKLPNYTYVKPNLPVPTEVLETESVQLIHYMTKGELSLIEGKQANYFNPDCPKKPGTKFISKPERIKSPPLSIMSKEWFFSEVKLFREEEKTKRLQEKKGHLARGLSRRDNDKESNIVNKCKNDVNNLSLDGVLMDLKSVKSQESHSKQESKTRSKKTRSKSTGSIEESSATNDRKSVEKIANDTDHDIRTLSDNSCLSSDDTSLKVEEINTDNNINPDNSSGNDVENECELKRKGDELEELQQLTDSEDVFNDNESENIKTNATDENCEYNSHYDPNLLGDVTDTGEDDTRSLENKECLTGAVRTI
ncbi:uncharacterized protein [Antedon mediterranea]|uniref:uncharacterized protein n=1 Tax=Antedon mediterranea TaxID=105859 RepID=UPI003AF73C7B